MASVARLGSRERWMMLAVLAAAGCGATGAQTPASSGTAASAGASGAMGSPASSGTTTSTGVSVSSGAVSICTPPMAPADTRTPARVVGNGTASSCTEADLSSALTAGGVVTFNCGTAPVTVPVTHTIELPTNKDTVIDGGGTITLDGGGAVRILDWNSPNYRNNAHSLTLQHITLSHGRATGTAAYALAPPPCSTGFYDGAGGALQMRDGVLHVIDATFLSNQAEALGPDVGGGAIYLTGALGGVIVGSVFLDNTGSNAGAIGALNADIDVYNSRFEGNAALGMGANSDDATKCGVVAKTGQHQVGSGGNGGAVGIDGGSDGTHTFCGVTFKANKGGAHALGGALARTPDNAKQTTVIDRCLFDGNTAESAAAVYLHNSTLRITASSFTGNVGRGIGAIQADGTTVDLTNVTFYGNHSAAGVGATLALFGGDGTITNCTFANNVCDGANMFAAAIFGSPSLTIRNTIFDGNTAQNPGAPMQCEVGASMGTGDLQWPKYHVSGGAADALCVPGIYEDTDPGLGVFGDHGGPVPTVLPAPGSPALLRGTACPATDARGKPRNVGSCTAGACEGTN